MTDQSNSNIESIISPSPSSADDMTISRRGRRRKFKYLADDLTAQNHQQLKSVPGYQIYAKQRRAEVMKHATGSGATNYRDANKFLACEWAAMGEQEKETFREQAAELTRKNVQKRKYKKREKKSEDSTSKDANSEIIFVEKADKESKFLGIVSSTSQSTSNPSVMMELTPAPQHLIQCPTIISQVTQTFSHPIFTPSQALPPHINPLNALSNQIERQFPSNTTRITQTYPTPTTCTQKPTTSILPSNPVENDQKQKIPKKFADPTNLVEFSDSDEDSPPISIFTPEFLEYNKKKELEMSQISKMNRELEQLNRILHSNRQSWQKLISETKSKLEAKKLIVAKHRENAKIKLAKYQNEFKGIELPTRPSLKVEDDTMAYVEEMCSILSQNNPNHMTFMSTAYYCLQRIYGI